MTLRDANQSRCATYEVMLMGMNTAIDKPEVFPEMIKKAIEDLATINTIENKPQELGHLIGIKHK